MSSMRDLLEKITFAGKAVGQKPGDQVRGSEPMPKKGSKQHPYKGRLVGGGAAESVGESENLLKELDKIINSNPVKRDLFQEWHEFTLKEYGAPGSAIGNDTGTNPAEQAALRQQQNLQRKEVNGQIGDLNAQLSNSRAQIAQLNRAFPQGANPVEKAMSLKDIQAQKIALQNQIEDLVSQIAAMRSQIK